MRAATPLAAAPLRRDVSSARLAAAGWADAPAESLEFVLLLAKGLIRRVGLILKNEQGIYDRVAIYKNKKTAELNTIITLLIIYQYGHYIVIYPQSQVFLLLYPIFL